jgi:hypothetical protein
MAATAVEPRDMSGLTQRSREVRNQREESKRWVRSAPTSRASRERVIELLRARPQHLLNVEVRVVLRWSPRTGEKSIARIMTSLKLGHCKPVRDLTDRQVGALGEIYIAKSQHMQLPLGSSMWGPALDEPA